VGGREGGTVKVLVTGSDGFLGRHAMRTFLQLGHDVQGVDIQSGTDCRDVFASDTYFDIVLHFAAIVGGRATIDGNPLAVAQTIALDVALFNYAERVRPGHVIYPSSSAAYPVSLQTREHHTHLQEDHINLQKPELPDAMYGWVKLTGEQMASRCSAPVTCLRPMSGYGSDQDTTYPFGAFRARALSREDPFVIWGDGTQVRDWIHVDDIMEAILSLITSGFTGPINIGTGMATDFLKLSELFTSRSGYSPSIQTLPDKPTGVHYRVANVDKLHDFYIPRISIEEGIERAMR